MCYTDDKSAVSATAGGYGLTESQITGGGDAMVTYSELFMLLTFLASFASLLLQITKRK